jgi:membrane-bound ClpP family serine protease
MMIALGTYAYIAYRFGKRALVKKPMIYPPEVGSMGKATTPLTPKGYVRVGSELWKALSTSSIIHKDEEVVIVGINGLTVLVAPVDSGNHETGGEAKTK